MEEITKEQRDYLLSEMPEMEITIIGRNKSKKRKHYYVPNSKRINQLLRLYEKERHRNGLQ